mmetsp:Transcript_20037/g.23070  ORF Transcript_20037/g.23070 Transcript_20037/m.23070 type:complete len:309 (-) Transcript_20037:196-1122(-)
MFGALDREVIHHILVKNKGRVDPTIEDLLALTDDCHPEDENLFQEAETTQSTKQKSANSYASNGGNSRRGDGGYYEQDSKKDMQEQKDLEMALKLQQKYMQENDEGAEGAESNENPNQKDSKQQNSKDPKAKGKSLKTKISDKFNSLFGKKKPAATQQPTEKNTSQQQKNHSQQPTQYKTPPKQEYTFAQIAKFSDKEVICFDNPIGGGNFYQYVENPGEKKEDVVFESMGEIIPLNKKKSESEDQPIYFNKQFGNNNHQYESGPNKFFRVSSNDDDEETYVGSNGSTNHSTSYTQNNTNNGFLYGAN